jgi:hypothetical protein
MMQTTMANGEDVRPARTCRPASRWRCCATSRLVRRVLELEDRLADLEESPVPVPNTTPLADPSTRLKQ